MNPAEKPNFKIIIDVYDDGNIVNVQSDEPIHPSLIIGNLEISKANLIMDMSGVSSHLTHVPKPQPHHD